MDDDVKMMDPDLEYICSEIGLTKKKRRLIAEEYSIHNLDDLLQLKSRLENGDDLGSMVEEIKHKLLMAAEWRRKYPEVNLLVDFDEDVWNEWKKSCNEDVRNDGEESCNNYVAGMDADMNKICESIGTPKKSRLLIIKYGITSVDTLHSVLASKLELEELRKDLVQNLTIASKWIRDNLGFDVLGGFDEELFHNIRKIHDDELEHYNVAKFYNKWCMGSPYKEYNLKHYNKMNSTNRLLDKVIELEIAATMKSPNLREKVGNFDHGTFLDKAFRCFHDAVGRKDHKGKMYVVAGRTQSGKSAVKGVIQSMGGVLEIPVIVLTKGVDESIDLNEKLRELSEWTPVKREHVVVASNKKDRMSYREKNAKVERAFGGGGMLVIADTKAQVQKALRALEDYREKNPGGKFILVVDEADAMFRTKDRSQVFEQNLEALRATNPAMTVMISATPIPFMLEIVAKEETGGEDIEFINFSPNSNYLGVEDIVPLIDRDGKKVYLQQNELTSEGHAFDGIRIPYANPKVKALYDDALGHEKGVLLLDASSPRVNADSNIYQKAEAVQALYHKKEIPLIAVTISGGKGIHVRLPPGLEAIGKIIDLPEDSKMADDWEFSLTSSKFQKWRNNLIGDLLNCLDAAFGLSVPIFVFGYTKMRRGISFRSDKRVVTHMLMILGRGQNASGVAQTLGRATGNCRDVLGDNGFDCVKVLTTSNDLTTCIKMNNYINEIGRRMGQGDTIFQAMTGATVTMPDDANFARHTFREIGPIKGRKKLIQNAFEEEITWGPSEEDTREKYWEDTNAQQVMRSIGRLTSAHKYFDPDDIKHELIECANIAMTKKSILQTLNKFVDDCLVKKTQNHVGGAREFQLAQNVNWLCKFMNPAKGEVPDEEDLQCSSEEESIVSSVESEDSCWSDIAKAATNSSASNTSDGSKEESPNRTFDGDEQSVSSGRNISTAATISPEKLGSALTAKRKALAVFQSESSEKRKKRKKRKKRNPYSHLQGVEEFGEGKWKKICNRCADTFDLNMRTPVNLKDLYRTL